jgi:predicted MFS family arabinose efflux permease
MTSTQLRIPALMFALYGWRLSFVVAGVAAVLLGVIWLATVPDRAIEKQAAQRPQWSALLNNSSMRWLIVGFAALDYYKYILFYWLYYYLGEVRKLSASDTAVFTTFPFLAILRRWARSQQERRPKRFQLGP